MQIEIKSLCSRCTARYTLAYTRARTTIWDARNLRCTIVYAKHEKRVPRFLILEALPDGLILLVVLLQYWFHPKVTVLLILVWIFLLRLAKVKLILDKNSGKERKRNSVIATTTFTGAIVIKNLAHIYLSFFHHKNNIWGVFIETLISRNMVKSEDHWQLCL